MNYSEESVYCGFEMKDFLRQCKELKRHCSNPLLSNNHVGPSVHALINVYEIYETQEIECIIIFGKKMLETNLYDVSIH